MTWSKGPGKIHYLAHDIGERGNVIKVAACNKGGRRPVLTPRTDTVTCTYCLAYLQGEEE